MLSLLPLIAHLSPEPAGFNGLWFRQVGGVAEYASIHPEALPLPACWVVRNAEKSDHAGLNAENLTIAFDVIIAIENVQSHTPGDTDEALLVYRKAVKDLLLGWEIEPDVRPMNFDGGRVIEYTDGDLYWADRYSFQALITNYLPDPVVPFFNVVKTGVTL
jgi:hypothetical protein